MKSNYFAVAIVAVSTLSAVSAFAQTTTQNHLYGEAANVVTFDTAPSKLTRAQVRAEFLQAGKNNALPLSAEAGIAPTYASTSSLTREQVAASMAKAHALDGSGKLTQH